MSTPDRDLPDGTDLANALGEFLNSGGKLKDLFASQSAKSIPIEPAGFVEQRASLLEMMDIKDTFFSNFDPNKARRVNRREAAQGFRVIFDDWKKKQVRELERSSHPLKDDVQNLTLSDMAKHARERFEEWKQKLGRAVPDSEEFKHARKQADFWSIMDEIVGPAADPDQTF